MAFLDGRSFTTEELMFMRVIFSRNRAAQLDLLLRSLDEHSWREETRILWYADSEEFLKGYLLLDRYRDQTWTPYGYPSELGRITPPNLFNRDLRAAFAFAGPLVTFFCDDDVVIRPVPYDPAALFRDEQLLTFSWRLDGDGQQPWRWGILPRTDHGYPGSIDGHTFRTADMHDMIGGETIADPTMLETVLAARCEERVRERPLMAAFAQQVLVGVPVNRVSERSGCPHGERFPQSAEELNERFLAGERIKVPNIQTSACHVEVPFEWSRTVWERTEQHPTVQAR